ncbi:MAG TPA: hypothetical protein VEL70_08295 [Candidatus Acidoferrum sp.]|nr:hypothetical protein [Candidatus Acidoferrum sp.]
MKKKCWACYYLTGRKDAADKAIEKIAEIGKPVDETAENLWYGSKASFFKYTRIFNN